MFNETPISKNDFWRNIYIPIYLKKKKKKCINSLLIISLLSLIFKRLYTYLFFNFPIKISLNEYRNV